MSRLESLTRLETTTMAIGILCDQAGPDDPRINQLRDHRREILRKVGGLQDSAESQIVARALAYAAEPEEVMSPPIRKRLPEPVQHRLSDEERAVMDRRIGWELVASVDAPPSVKAKMLRELGLPHPPPGWQSRASRQKVDQTVPQR